MDSTTHIIVNQHQLTDETFEPKLKDVADQIFSNGLSQPTILSNLLNVVDACISTTHIAFLLDDGRVCRVSYNIQTDKIDTVNSNTTSSMSSSSSGGGGGGGGTTSNPTTTTTTSSNDTPKSKTKIQNTNTILSNSASSSTGGGGGGISASVASAIGTINSVTQNTSTTSATSGGGATTGGSSQLNTTQFRPQSRAGFRSHETFIIPSAQEILAPISTHSFGRGRRGQLLRGRVSSLIVGSRIPSIVPASAVPESLIESVQTVLQSKSRNVIIRELQRTNLDVNLAVNNLLQRDDEGDDGGDDDDPYLHGGDDLISLLDINSHAGDHSVIIDSDGTVFDEDTFRITRRLSRNISSHAAAAAAAAAAASGTGGTGSSGSGTTDTSTSGSGDRDRKSYRLRDQRWYDTTSSSSSSSYRDEMFQSRLDRDTTTTNATNTTTSTSSTQQQQQSQQNTSSTGGSSQIMSKLDEMLKKQGASTQNPISFGENLQFWTEKNGETPVFIKIASLYSELVAISKSGQLYQWKWSCEQPYSNQDNPNQHHPKSLYLNILNERVLSVSTSTVRASIHTESGKIATWLDESVDIICTNKFQMSAQQLFDPTTDSILQMSVSNIYTVIRMASGSLYWWGIMPFEHRAKLIEKYQSKAHKMKLSLANEISVGSYVCLKTLPLYSSGTVAVTIKDGQPKIGQLVEHMFSFRDSKLIKFKLRTADSFKDSVDNASSSVSKTTSVEMPPPSTPETLTSSNTLKRKKLSSESESSGDRSKQPSQTYSEESWPLSDVIFVDDSKTYSLGKVIKIDSDYVIVKMQSKSMSDSLIDAPSTSTATSLSQTIESQTLLDNCRIFQKSQLQTFKAASSLRLPDFIQKSPKRLTDIGSVIAFTAQNNGLHAISIKENTMFYIFYDIITNKVIREKRFPTRIHTFGNNMNNIVLQALDDPQFNYLTFIDGNSTLYPLLDINSASNNTIKDPLWKNLFPIKYFTQSVLQVKTGADNFKKLYITLFSMKIENLITNILRYDVEKVNILLKLIEIEYRNDPQRVKTILNERIDGNRNLLHAAVFACAPITNNDSNGGSTSSSVGFQIPLKTLERSWSSSKSDPLRKVNVGLDSILITPNSSNSAAIVPGSGDTNSSISDHSYGGSTRAAPGGGGDTSSNDDLTASIWPPIIEQMQMDTSKGLLPSTSSKETLVYPPVRLDEKEKKLNSIKILQIILESPVLKEHLIELLSYKNAEGATPFMYAVNIRAYNAALLLLESAISIRKEAYSQNKDGNSIFYNMIFPIGSNVDNSPLYVLCCNDTCSFTWTGDNHITQDIFECRTCTLVGNLCCCTECARTCHKGHDCKIKTSSPTAYCDCWEKCKCKSLIAGDQEKRFDLLCKLLNETNLLQLPNSRGENLLLFLAQTVGRQILEQKNYKRSSVLNRKSHQIDSDMPQHDLEPPHFSRRAFDHILSNWSAVKEMLLFNYKQNIHLSQLTLDTYDDSVYLDNQNGCIDLDKFTYTLIVKCPSEMLNALLSTLSKETELNNESVYIIKRFLRSIARLYVVLIMESVPTPTNVFSQSSYQSSKYRKNTFLPTNTPISKCESVFKQFPVMCVEELINIAQSLISPVLLGNSKPTIFKPLQQEDTRIDKQNYVLADELFNIESPMQRQFSMTQAYNQMQQSRIETTVTAIPPPQQPSTSTGVAPPPPPPSTAPTTLTRSSNRRRHDSPNLSNTSATANTVANEQPTTSSNYSISMLTAPSIRTQQDNVVPPPPPTTQPPPPPPPPVTRSVSVVIPMDDDQQSDQISDNDDSEANTRDNFVLQEDMDLNLFAESDSDSDNSNNSNRDNASAAQRSAITAATVGTGSDPGGAYFSDNDSDVSSNQEEDEEDSDIRSDILTVDNDNSELFHLNSEQSSNEFYNRQVQWSLRRHNAGGSSTTGGGSGSGTTGADIARIHHTNTSAPPPSLTSTSASVAAAAVAAAAQFNPTSSLYQDIHMRRAAASGGVSLNAVSQPPQQIPQQHPQSGQTSLSSNLANSLHHTQHHHTAHHHLHSIHQQTSEAESIINTNNTLARGFSLILKLIRDLLNGLYQKEDKSFDLQNFNNLLEYINQKLEPTWKWLVLLLDSNESQLRFGCSLTASIMDSNVTQYLKSLEDKAISNNSSKQHDINRRRQVTQISGAQLLSAINNSTGVSSRTSANDAIHTRKDFMNYALSLMRFESNEHKETLPTIDISLLKHVAYVFDGIMYYLRLPISEDINTNESTTNQSTTATGGGATTSSNTVTMHHTSASMSSLYEAEEIESETEMETSIGASYQTDSASEEDDSFKSNACNRTNTFFKRSDSTLCLGGSSPDPFSLSLEESLPLAAKPHLLQPHTRKQEMFKVQSNQVDQFNALNKLGGGTNMDQRQLPKLVLPLFKKSTTFSSTKVASLAHSKSVPAHLSDSMTYDATSSIKTIINSFSRSNASASANTSTDQAGMMSTSATNDLLDLSLNKAQTASSGSTTGQRASSSFKKQMIQPTLIYEFLNLPTNKNHTDQFFDRWRLTLDLFGRVFCDDVGLENGSIIRQLGGFQIKETRFRREMEKYRNSSNKELNIEVERDRDSLIQTTFKALNNLYAKRTTSTSSSLPPLCLSRIKVTFKDEQGEGSGVARSFYTAFSEAILSTEKLPSLENVYSHSVSSTMNSYVSLNMLQRYRNTRDHRRRPRSRSREANERTLCTNASPFYIPGTSTSTNADFTLYESLSATYKDIGEKLYNKIVLMHPSYAPKITGMLLDLKIQQLQVLLNSDNSLRAKVEEALNLIISANVANSSTGGGDTQAAGGASQTTSGQSDSSTMPFLISSSTSDEDSAPLFWQADKKGFYSPRPGKNSAARLNAFRNVGRIIGICLLQNELLPVPLSRHIIKYILNRQIKWHDLAFFDSVMYESFRKMIYETEKNGDSVCKALDLTFNIDLCKDEDGTNYDLIENGSNIEVNKNNMYEFVKRYAEYRMVKRVEQCCSQLKLGIYDVLPANSLNGLNAEDFRLLLNGIVEINVQTLMSYTTINDESKESAKRLQFEKWFWSTVEKMNNQEKQELLFFWTGSPYLPASDEGFQPLPSITIRPASDQHLPTANTCINRLYIPLYSSKSILKSKLLYAIKTKSFGFV